MDQRKLGTSAKNNKAEACRYFYTFDEGRIPIKVETPEEEEGHETAVQPSHHFSITSDGSLDIDVLCKRGGVELLPINGGVEIDSLTFPDGKYSLVQLAGNAKAFNKSLLIKVNVPTKVYLVETPGSVSNSDRKASQLSSWFGEHSIEARQPATGDPLKIPSKLLLPGGVINSVPWPGSEALLILALHSQVSLQEISQERSHFAQGQCAVCGWCPQVSCPWQQLPVAEALATLRAHIDTKHPQQQFLVTPLADRMETLAREEQSKEYAILKQDAKKGKLGPFRRLASVGPKRKGWSRYAERYSCNVCGLSFQTSVGAMKKHTKAHKRGELMKIGKVRVMRNGKAATPGLGSVRNLWRPEGHLLSTSAGASSFGPDARLAKILIPKTAWKDLNVKNEIVCRKCTTWELELDPAVMSLRMLSKRIDMMRSHEKKRKGANKRSKCIQKRSGTTDAK
ncbi:unnamed protein product [Amoebophrya sp. A25]|nr:unnamed protein product [Amoebophrya sp. A25]|eukprot:GSA25T00019183001.1